MSAIRGYIKLARPLNMLICGLSAICGGIIGEKPLALFAEFITFSGKGNYPSWALRTFFAAVSASLILAAGNTLNDICDIKADRINAPKRPIPSGMISVYTAAVFAGILALAGLITALPLGVPGVTVAVAAALLLTAYDLRLKGIPLAGNLTVAVLGGLAFVYGGIAGNCVREALVPAVFATLYHLGREILKDAADIHGDSDASIRTAATVWGVQTACRLASIVLIILAFVVTIPFITGQFGTVYTVIISFGVCPVLLYSAVSSIKDSSEANLRRISLFLKADMPLGIAAVLAGFQGW